ncbi:MAG: LPS export ABC transporter permease LptF, partial [Paracoccaceae bacterium]|nr:LPS export ABC transporter permease LptF [Paracoccaceae bacterium]
TNADRAAFLYEANVRFAAALNAMVASVAGFATLLLGGFSRFGNWRQILIGVGMLIGLQLMIDWTAGFAVADARLWPMVYLPSLVGAIVNLALLWWSERPARRPALRGEYAS